MSLIPFASAVQKFNRQRSYQISRSLRFNSADSAYLNRTQGTSTNQNIATWSFWFKRSTLGTNQKLFEGYTASSDTGTGGIEFGSDNKLYVGGFSTNWRVTTQLFRDPSAWYHFVIAVDTTKPTIEANNRLKIYVNGSEVTAFDTTNNPTQNSTFGLNNNSAVLQIGRRRLVSNNDLFFNGYLTEINCIDGQALTPLSFGEYNATTGVWQPKEYTGTYGTNGFYLNFSDNSNTTAATLGKDYSGNGNNWTPNLFSVTAGVGNDSLVDVPTPFGTDTGAGGTVRGNYATLNPLKGFGGLLVNGNLDITNGSSAYVTSIAFPQSGKWYCEFSTPGNTTSTACGVTVRPMDSVLSAIGDVNSGNTTYYRNDGSVIENGSYNATYSAWSTGANVIGVALDMDAKTVQYYLNNTAQGASARSLLSTTSDYTAFIYNYTSGQTLSCNFGQRPFAHTAPSGFKALCTQNLPDPTIKKGGEYFNTVLYTGNGSTLAVTGVGFQPDFVWLKSRGAARSHRWWDVLRGVTKGLSSDLTNAEYTESGLTAFDSNGFTLGSQSGSNTNAESFVAWNWKANGAGVINTAGTITSNVSVNTTAGFSIITYTGNGYANQTVGHGLGVAPAFGILKDRDPNTNNDQWQIFHTAAGDKYGYFTTAAFVGTAEFYPTSGSSTTVTIARGSPAATTNESGDRYVMYLFAPVAGYSAFGSYTGNNSATDGTFVYLGFRPRFLMIKSTSAGTEWVMMDTVRPGGNTYNLADTSLYANRDYSETTVGTVNDIDFLSNGFKLRNNTGFVNASQTYIYAAFAENPFKYSLAR